MPTLNVTHPNGQYPIRLETGGLHQLGSWLNELGHNGRCAVVTNPTVGEHYLDAALTSLREAGFTPIGLEIPDGEQYKTLATVAQLYDMLIEAKLDRKSPVIALGGGVVGDTVGFAAASYLRGVPFVQIPTSLLAMVDASVGGKTGVDLPQGKNLVGAFKQPEMVLIDPDVLDTLPLIEVQCGLAETIKHGIIDSPRLFNALVEAYRGTDPSAEAPRTAVKALLAEAVSVKIRVVQEDPFEGGRRAVLNLGHTFAHAFERLAGFDMRHGEAVAMGLVCAAKLAQYKEECAPDTAQQMIDLVTAVGLPTKPPAFSADAVWQAMFTDKKRSGNTIRFILPRDIGDVDIFSNVTFEDMAVILG